jgi:hypothetical protein
MRALNKIPAWKKITPDDYNKLIDRLNILSKISSHSGIDSTVSSLGVNVLQSQAGKGVTIRLYEVQSAATGDGLYTCYRQKIDATNWANEAGLDKLLDYDTTNVTVLNLNENDPVEGTYVAALATKDRIAAWQMSDDEGNLRWVGIPLVPHPRRARTTAAAGAATTIVCNLIDNEGNEIAAGLGSGITVNCEVSPSGNINDALPCFANDDYLFAEWIAGKWYYAAALGKVDIC